MILLLLLLAFLHLLRRGVSGCFPDELSAFRNTINPESLSATFDDLRDDNGAVLIDLPSSVVTHYSRVILLLACAQMWLIKVEWANQGIRYSR